jgi:hypothetical protein
MNRVTNRDRPPGFVTPCTPDPRNATNDRTPRRFVTRARRGSRGPRPATRRQPRKPRACVAWKTCRPQCDFPQSAGPVCSGWKISAAIAGFPRSACSGPFHFAARGPIGAKAGSGAPDRRDAAWWPGSPAGDAQRQRRSAPADTRSTGSLPRPATFRDTVAPRQFGAPCTSQVPPAGPRQTLGGGHGVFGRAGAADGPGSAARPGSAAGRVGGRPALA